MADFFRFLSRIPLWIQIFTIAGLTSILGVGVVGGTASRMLSAQLENQLGDFAMSLSWAVGTMPQVQTFLEGKPSPGLPELIETIKEKTGVSFVVPVTVPFRRENGAGGRVLGQGEAYLARGAGPLGPSLRALTPVYSKGRQVGAVSVGMLMEELNSTMEVLSHKLWTVLFVGLLLAIFGALFVAWNVKRSLWGLEPREIGRLHGERESILESIKEGLLAVDGEGRITMLNSSARKLLREQQDIRGEPVEHFIPDTRLPEVIASGKAQYDEEMLFRDTRVMANRVPIHLRGRVVGAVASFRDMTEIQTLAEEVTGVKTYLEALRAQHHEFRNKLQAISGLVQLDEKERVLDFIDEVVGGHDSATALVMERIKNPALGGLLLGKMGRARELDITLTLEPRSVCARESVFSVQSLVVMVGNLLDNAMEAVRALPRDRRWVRIAIEESRRELLLQVADSGPGIPPSLREKIFERGFSTKEKKEGGEFRGYGLYTVRNLAEAQGGDFSFRCPKSGGTVFTLRLFKKEEPEA